MYRISASLADLYKVRKLKYDLETWNTADTIAFDEAPVISMSVNNMGEPWVVTVNREIWSQVRNDWIQQAGTAIQIAIGINNHVWYLNDYE